MTYIPLIPVESPLLRFSTREEASLNNLASEPAVEDDNGALAAVTSESVELNFLRMESAYCNLKNRIKYSAF